MTIIRRLMWPGVLIALIGASVAVHVIMLVVIHMHPGMTQDMRQAPPSSPALTESPSTEPSPPHQ